MSSAAAPRLVEGGAQLPLLLRGAEGAERPQTLQVLAGRFQISRVDGEQARVGQRLGQDRIRAQRRRQGLPGRLAPSPARLPLKKPGDEGWSRRGRQTGAGNEEGLRGTQGSRNLHEGAAGEGHAAARAQQLVRRAGLRLRLRVESLSLAALPWEYTYVQRAAGEEVDSDFLGLQRKVSIARYETIGAPLKPLEAKEKIRIVAALANPIDHPANQS